MYSHRMRFSCRINAETPSHSNFHASVSDQYSSIPCPIFVPKDVVFPVWAFPPYLGVWPVREFEEYTLEEAPYPTCGESLRGIKDFLPLWTESERRWNTII